LKYRAEIDGLRALAVVPVILFHAGFELFSGGFVGVDVFFVISGYLITTILIEDIENKRFSIVNFYERRARRILPALFFVMLVCIPFAWMWMLPIQMTDFSQSLVAVGLFASNVLFWLESDYFAAASEEKPLLHTWSLAVEEQYYVIFPIFLLIAWRFGRNRVFWVIVSMAVISLLFSEWGWRNKATANFYLAPTRAWELLSGSIVAFYVQKHGVQKNNFLSSVGFVAIIFSIFAYDESTPFPSLYALVPVLGVLLLILYAENKTFAGRLLSNQVFVGVGLISYSAYLWHQPLFAFARIRMLEHPSEMIMLILSLLSLMLAYISWRYVEAPFRNKSLVSKRKVFFLSIISLSSFITFGLFGYYNQGFPNRFPDSFVKTLNDVDPRNRTQRLIGIGCHFSGNLPRPLPSACGVNNWKNQTEVLLLGDSHLDAIGYQLLDRFKAKNISAYALSYNSCAPIGGLYRPNADSTFQCSEYNKVVRKFAETHGVKTIVLVARFPLYLLGERYNNGEGGIENGGSLPLDIIKNVKLQEHDVELSREERVAERYRTEIQLLARDFNVIIFSPTPEVGWDVPSYYSKLTRFTNYPTLNDVVVSHSLDNYLKRTHQFTNILSSIESDKLHVYEVHKLFCDYKSRRCLANFGGNLLYRDDDHLSPYAANIVSEDFFEFYEKQMLIR